MNGNTNSADFKKVIVLSVKWGVTNPNNTEGVIEQNNVPVSWTFSEDYLSLINNKGVVFNRIKMR